MKNYPEELIKATGIDIPLIGFYVAHGTELFEDLNKPQAIVGATDMAMRLYLPKDIMAFTVTKPLYERLCKLDDNSFLQKSFIKRLKKARKKF